MNVQNKIYQDNLLSITSINSEQMEPQNKVAKYAEDILSQTVRSPSGNLNREVSIINGENKIINDKEMLIKKFSPYLKKLTSEEQMALLSYDAENETTPLHCVGSVKLALRTLAKMDTSDLLEILSIKDGYDTKVIAFKENFKDALSIVKERSNQEIINFLSNLLSLIDKNMDEVIPVLEKLTLDEILSIKNQLGKTIFHNPIIFPKISFLLEDLSISKLVEILTLKDNSSQPKTPFIYCQSKVLNWLMERSPEDLSKLFKNSFWLYSLYEYKIDCKIFSDLFMKMPERDVLQFLLLPKNDQGETHLHNVVVFELCLPILKKLDFNDLKRVLMNSSGTPFLNDPEILDLVLPIINKKRPEQFRAPLTTKEEVLYCFIRGIVREFTKDHIKS